MIDDLKYLKLAIEKSQESVEKGFFPAGAVVVQNGKILSSEVSAAFPDYQHAEIKALNRAFNKVKQSLIDCTLYSSMEPCLMCIATAYWAGIRRVVFAISKNSLNREYYESDRSIEEIVRCFHEKTDKTAEQFSVSKNSKNFCNIEVIYSKELESEAINIVRLWERNNKC